MYSGVKIQVYYASAPRQAFLILRQAQDEEIMEFLMLSLSPPSLLSKRGQLF
jgi:hypothetical protein